MTDSSRMMEKRYCVEVVVGNIADSVVADRYYIDVVAETSTEAYSKALSYCAARTKVMRSTICFPKSVKLSD